MKIKSLFAVLCLMVVGFTACQKELSQENGSGGGAVGGVTGDFRAKIDGVQWVANQTAGAARTGGVINITGVSTDGKLVTITLMDSGVHVYKLNDTTMNASAYGETPNGSTLSFTSNASDDTSLAGGTVSITAIDTVSKKLSGTFKYRVFRINDNQSRAFTEGSFTNLTYTTTIGVPPNAATDTFRVKLNDTAWTNYNVTSVAVASGINKITITSNYDANGSRNLGLAFSNTITPGSYTFDTFLTAGIYNPTNSITNPSTLMADGGNLTILEHNTTTKRIRGTFNFVAHPLTGPTPIATFTEGYFSVIYQ